MPTTLTHNAIYGSSAQVGYGIGDLRRHVAVIRGMLTGIPSSHTLGDIQKDINSNGQIPATYTVRTQDDAGTPSNENDDIPAVTLPAYRVTVTRIGPTKALVEAEYRNVFTNTQPPPPSIDERVDYSTSVEYVNVYTVPQNSTAVSDYLPDVSGAVDYHLSDGPRTVALQGGQFTTGGIEKPEPYQWPVPTVRISVAVNLGSSPPSASTAINVGKVNGAPVLLQGQSFNPRTLRFDGIDAERTLDSDGNTNYVGVYKYTAAAHEFRQHAVIASLETLATGEEAVVYEVVLVDLHEQVPADVFPLP